MRPIHFIALILPLSLACAPAHRESAGDAGSDDPRPSICGDLFVNAGIGEQCDDGNTDSGDGCDQECQVEIPEECGNGVFEEDLGEECDDGNHEPGDGCGPGCWIEGCGNNFLDPGEACEDNNTVGGDGCSADCKSDETCGNGVRDLEEACDDGNGIDTDECPASCRFATCGDGFVRSGLESCDDGNAVAGDGCTDCILDSCGNGDLDDGEECDLGAGNGLNGTTCFRTCISTEIEAAEVNTMALDPNGEFGASPSDIHAGDFNGDGRFDLLISDPQLAMTSVAYGLGDGRVWPPTHNISPSTTVRSLALADVNAKLRTVVLGDML